ncbi:ABC transporter substrate-binding protein [bacterium]|nr:ABC transporter substrate-binding protein [bacterium]
MRLLLVMVAAVIIATLSLPVDAKEKVLTVGIENQPKTMDPRFSTDAYGMSISHHLLFSTLVQHGQDLQIVPNLAKGWETPDSITYIFHLRKNVRFHDGKPLTAKDVKFTFEHLKNPETGSPFAGTYKIIDSIRVIDNETVEFKLVQPVASFLTSIIMPIVPEHLIKGGTDFNGSLIGSGPFRFIKQTPNEIVLGKSPDYFMGSPKIDKVVFKVIKDDNTRFLKMRKGELDLLINAIPLQKVDDFRKSPLKDTYEVIEDPGLSYNYIIFNMKSELLQDVKLRQAIAYGINVDQIIKYRMDGHAAPSYSMLSPVNWFSEPAAMRYSYDPKKAEQLLDEAGLADSDGDGPKPRLKLELKTSNNPETVGIARIIQAQLAETGIEVDLKSYEWGTFYGDIKSGNFQMTIMRWVGVTEPDFYYDVFNSTQFPPAGRNRGLYENPEIDRLTEEGRVELDPNKRKAIYSKIQKIAARELPYVSLWHRNNVSIVHKRVSGYQQHPMGGFLSFNRIDLAE